MARLAPSIVNSREALETALDGVRARV